jgi:hypothetical protein
MRVAQPAIGIVEDLRRPRPLSGQQPQQMAVQLSRACLFAWERTKCAISSPSGSLAQALPPPCMGPHGGPGQRAAFDAMCRADHALSPRSARHFDEQYMVHRRSKAMIAAGAVMSPKRGGFRITATAGYSLCAPSSCAPALWRDDLPPLLDGERVS